MAMASEGRQGKDGDGDEDMGSASEELQAVLQPYILRRHKTDVMKKVPPKEEVVIEVEFTRLQKKIYRSIYEKNVIKAMFVNVSMELRKCCAHPYLIQGTEEAQLSSQAADPNDVNTVMTYLVQMSGKMVFLEKLLPRLKEDGQKVLIFSQMTRMLDIIQDYLRWRGYMSERLDGSSSSADRQAAIDRFNTPCDDDPHFDHSPFVFLLSTRAGGVGINLTAASVVVIYDSDWNPQNDTQAQARCHRIGQTKTVKVYRLITRDSYEQHMFDTASRKLGLEQALMSGVTKNSTLHLSKAELNNLIKNGAYAAFSKNEEGDQEKSDQFVSATIDDILSSDRARTVTYGTVVSGGRKSAFSKATFVANEEDLEPESPKMSQPSPSTEDGNNVSVDDTDFWRKLVGDDSLAQLMDEEAFDEDMGERRSKFSGSYAIPSLSEMIRQTQGGGGGAHGPTPAQSARQLERQRLGFWFSKSKRRDLHQMFRYGVYGQWEAFRDYLLEDETAHHDNSRKAAVPPSTTETASSTRGVGSSGSASLATPSPSEESSEEDYEGEDMNSRVDAGEIDEFGMVIIDESGEGREDGHAKDGGGETKEAGVDAEISPLRLKGLMIMWIGVLYRTIMTCAYGMVTRRRAAAEAKRAQEEEERQQAVLKESPDDGYVL
ncbi:choline dehydrogenase 7, partial [Perkinsus olseni]